MAERQSRGREVPIQEHDPDGPREVRAMGTAAIILALVLLQASLVVSASSPRASDVLLAASVVYIAMTAVLTVVAWTRSRRE